MQIIKLLATFIMLLLILMMGCYHNRNATPAPFTSTVLPLTAVYGVMPTRYEISKNVLTLSVKVKGVELAIQSDNLQDARRIKLETNFKNISENSIILRKPITYGFLGTGGSDNDLGIIIEMKDGAQMNVTSSSNYPFSLDTSSTPKITLDDFLELKPGEEFSYSIDITPPKIYIEETEYGGPLPPGKYILSVEYTNVYIGYKLPLDITPPASFGGFQAELEWYDNNIMVADLNAWVGNVFSNEVEFTIPAH